jgi:hypothetical protein
VQDQPPLADVVPKGEIEANGMASLAIARDRHSHFPWFEEMVAEPKFAFAPLGALFVALWINSRSAVRS